MARISAVPAWLIFAVVALLAALALMASPLGEPFREALNSRAALVLHDDFRGPLEGWFGSRDWAHSWSRDPAGYMRVGQLALYRPSLALQDYQLEFFGQAEKKNLSWVFRASDLRNYYVARLVVVHPGPPAQLALERAAVVAGVESQKVQVPIRELVDLSRPQHIVVDVVGNSFRTSLGVVVVDFWRD